MTAGGGSPIEHRVAVQRSARVYTVGNVHASAAWVVIHGYAQLAARFISNFAAIAGDDRVVIAPEALNRFYIDIPRPGVSATDRRVGTTWMTREDREAEIADYVAYLDGAISAVAPDVRDLTVLGFSQGVATACRWLALGHTRVRRLILWAGPMPPELDLRLLAARLNSVPVDIVMGNQDPIGDAGALDQQLDALQKAGIASRLTRFDGAHEMDAALIAQLAASA